MVLGWLIDACAVVARIWDDIKGASEFVAVNVVESLVAVVVCVVRQSAAVPHCPCSVRTA